LPSVCKTVTKDCVFRRGGKLRAPERSFRSFILVAASRGQVAGAAVYRWPGLRSSRALGAAVRRGRGLLLAGDASARQPRSSATAFYTARAGVGGKAVTLGPADQSTQVAIPVRKPQSYRPDLSALLSIKAAQKGQAGSYNGRSWQGEAQVRNITLHPCLCSCIVPGL